MAGFTTRTIHALHDVALGAVVPPIHTASTFLQPTEGGEGPFEYQRGSNPTRTDAETTLAALEGAQHSFAFATGMAATGAVLGTLHSGDSIIMGLPVYGGNYRWATIELPKRGVTTHFHDDLNQLSDEDFTENTRMVFLETPTNPTLRVTDIRRVVELAHRHGAQVVVDNTFLTPYLQRPLELGADVTVQSATKYLGGHGDLLGGVVSTNDDELAEQVHLAQMVSGGVLSPIDSYRLIQSVKTLGLRLDRQQENARRIVEFLRGREEVARVLVPGSYDDAEARIQEGQADGPGGLFSFELVPGKDVRAFLGRLQIFGFAVSLGGIESLICLPTTMTHGAYSPEDRETAHLTENLLRVAVGIEDVEDLLADLAQALDAA